MSLLFRTGITFLSFGSASGVENILKLIGLIILCAVIIAASFFVTKFIGGRQMGTMGESNFKSLDVFRLNQNSYLQLIQVGERYFVIAVSKDSVNTVAELKKEDITFWRDNDKKMSFKEVFAKATGENKGAVTEEKEEDKISDRKVE